VINLWASY